MGALISQSSYSLESMPIWLLNRLIGPGRNDGGILRWWVVFSPRPETVSTMPSISEA